jgi:CubicO group peptidase (beta-lactamase class C family)
MCLAQTPLEADQVRALVQRAHEKFGGAGIAVAVVQDGEPLVEVACGERAAGLPMTPTTLCNIASCTKAFTAASVALLVQEGKLGWDDRVVDHVPEFRMADPWISAHMTVRDLLSHRCGLVTFAGDLLWYGSDYDDAEVLRRIEKLPITQRFRDQFGYQNLMYLVAGILISRTSGIAWEDFVEQRFFAPLGMTASRACAQRLPDDAERATPHIDGVVVEEHEFTACRPAASISASVHELVPWMQMLLAGGKWNGKQMLTEASLQQMWRPHTGTSPGPGGSAGTGDLRSYGMGWFLSLERGEKLVEHDGGMPGFLSKVSLLPAERFGFVLLNNYNDGILNEALKRALLAARAGGDGMQQIDRLAQIAERIHARDRNAVEQREAARQADTQPSLDLGAYSGDYEDAVYGRAVVRREENGLSIELVPSRRRLFGPLSHWHHDTFRVDFPDRFLPFALVRFDLGHLGTVVGFHIDCPIADFDFGALDFRRLPAEPR